MTKVFFKQVDWHIEIALLKGFELFSWTFQQYLNFDAMMTIDFSFPKTRIQRSVMFDFDDLVGEIVI